MTRDMVSRLTFAGVALTALMAATLAASHMGAVRLGAGDVQLVMEKAERGLKVHIGARACTSRCGLDFGFSLPRR